MPDANFPDLPSNPQYRSAISWAAKYGVVSGNESGYFLPDEPCNRSQAVTFLFNMYRFVPAFSQ